MATEHSRDTWKPRYYLWLDGSAGSRDLPPDRRILVGTVGRIVVAKNHRRLVDALDLFVLSSDREGHPLTALEAQAAGTPVVLTDAGGSCEAIAREAGQSGGVLVEKSVEALAQAVREMILQPGLRIQRGIFARRYALEHFDKRHMVQRYADIFLDVGGHSRG